MKKLKYMVMVLVVSILFSGCAEIEIQRTESQGDEGQTAESQSAEDKGKEVKKAEGSRSGQEKETALVESIDISELEVPKEVYVYLGEFIEENPKKIAKLFLGSDFKENEPCADGRCFCCEAGTENERIVYVEDGGQAFFGERGHAADSGILFSGRNKFAKLFEEDERIYNMNREYSDAGTISVDGYEGVLTGIVNEESGEYENALKQTGSFLSDQNTVYQYLEQLGMSGYQPDVSASLNFGKSEYRDCYLMYWNQRVDGIQCSNILLENEGDKTVYNYRYQICNSELQAVSSQLEVRFVGNEMVGWYNYGMLLPKKQLQKYLVVAAETALKKVRECYPVSDVEKEKPELKRAELQYEILKKGEKIYFYPVWIFGVEHGDGAWEYYLMDAVSGDFFRDIVE